MEVEVEVNTAAGYSDKMLEEGRELRSRRRADWMANMASHHASPCPSFPSLSYL
jgi:hypothetical protein